jgi:phosphate starvation-inducible PhoH-like protein
LTRKKPARAIVTGVSETLETTTRKERRRIARRNAKVVKIIPKTEAQRHYLRALTESSVVIASGPAGTGKTYMAVTYGFNSVLEGKFKKLVITRRAIEADDDRIGFLPGDKNDKLYDYMRPSIDVLSKHLGLPSGLQPVLDTGFVEIEHLGSLRGRTFEDCFVILDEAQNTTDKLMRMLLTRIGEGSKIVVCGDLTQDDLPRGKSSGLKTAIEKLGAAPIFSIQHFTEEDVQRSEVVRQVLRLWPE